jgi:hypothetical protein
LRKENRKSNVIGTNAEGSEMRKEKSDDDEDHEDDVPCHLPTMSALKPDATKPLGGISEKILGKLICQLPFTVRIF